jgi:anti-sigma factor RsiW
MMNCEQAREWLDAYADRELDLARSVEVEEHLGHCPDCSKIHEGLRTLQTAIATHAVCFRAPKELCVIPETAPALSNRRRRDSGWRMAVTAAVCLLIGAVGFSSGYFLKFRPNDRRLSDLVVAAHVRSLQVEHAVDVASSDRHTVKPWFQGKLDYAPQVIDLSNQGFNLRGGRLDYLTDRPVAAIFYHRRAHAINVFTWPVSIDQEATVQRISAQGFHIRNWQRLGMAYWVISDLNDVELDEFVELLRFNQL